MIRHPAFAGPPPKYGLTCAFSGDSRKALDHAFAVLSTLNFRAESRSENELVTVGPGYRGTRENQLLGASRIRLAHEGDQLVLDAELGGLATMKKFIAVFPVVLVLVIGVFLGGMFALFFRMNLLMPLGILGAVLGIQLLFWSSTGPFIARTLEARTKLALETLLNNAAVAGLS